MAEETQRDTRDLLAEITGYIATRTTKLQIGPEKHPYKSWCCNTKITHFTCT